MVGQAYINNKDLNTWGACLGRGAYEALLKPAPAKELLSNNSRLQNGKQVIADNFRLDERNIAISFWIVGVSEIDYLQKYQSFLDEVTKGVIILKVPYLRTIYKLIYTDCSSYGHYDKKGKITLKLNEPSIDDRIAL